MHFNDNGQIEPTVDFDWDAVDSNSYNHTGDALREARLEGITQILRIFSAAANTRAIGQRVVLAAFLAGVGEEKTQRALAIRLGLTPGRVSQMLKNLRAQLAMAARR